MTIDASARLRLGVVNRELDELRDRIGKIEQAHPRLYGVQPADYTRMVEQRDKLAASLKEEEARYEALMDRSNTYMAKLVAVVKAARACYVADDFVTKAREGDGRIDRDNALGDALAELDA